MSIDQESATGQGVVWISSPRVIGSVPLDDLLLRAVALACAAVPAAISGGFATFDGRGRVTAAVALGETAWEIEAVAFVGGSGPGPEAARETRAVHVDDMVDVVDRYPAFAQAALDRAIVSSLSAPVVANGIASGVLTVYAESAHGFDGHATEVVAEVAAFAGPILADLDGFLPAHRHAPRGQYLLSPVGSGPVMGTMRRAPGSTRR